MLHHVVNELDYVRDVTVVDVRYLVAKPSQGWEPRRGHMAPKVSAQ